MDDIPSEPDSVPKQAPLISIITVVYNSQQFLEGTIQSIAAQQSSNFEYIIIDGGSTDGTLDIVKSYPEVVTHWISEPDKGLYDAMNKGLKVAKGQYVWFINSGDKIYDESTVLLLESMACGTSVVSFNIGGVPEMVEDGVSGAISGTGLAKVMSKLIQCRTLEIYRFNARKGVEEKYNNEIVSKRYCEIYSKE